MRLKEVIQREKAEMIPERFKFNYVFLPVWLLMFAAAVATLCILGARGGDRYLVWIVLLASFAVIWVGALVPFGLRVAKIELDVALQEYAYLFEKTEACFEETEALDEELNIKFLLKKDGLQITYPSRGEAVFTEMEADKEFLPWTDTYLALATENFCRKVRLALVVFDKTKQAALGYDCPPPEPFFLSMTKELSGAIFTLGLAEELGPDFHYLCHNPKKAMKQILDFGYIKKFS